MLVLLVLFGNGLLALMTIDLVCTGDGCRRGRFIAIDGRDIGIFFVVWGVCALVLLGYLRRYRHWFALRRESRGQVALFVLTVSGLMALMSMSLAMQFNAFGAQASRTWNGRVADRWCSSGRTREYLVVIESEGEAPIRVALDYRQFRELRVGDRARCTYRIGRLGWAFRWRRSDPRACAFQFRQ